LRYLGVDYCCTDADEANLIAIGSILSTLSGIVTDRKSPPYPYYDCIDIWGTGFIQEKQCKNEFFIKNVNIHALRGKLSKARSEAILGRTLDEIALGDPGLLISRAITVSKVKKKYDVGVIPHYVDKNSDLLNKIKLQNKSYKIIDVQKNTHQICKEICECRMILSSAMHGLVAADSYGIPNRWIRFSDDILGGNYKFHDYYSVFDIEGLEPIDLRKEIISDQEIDSFVANYPIKKGDVERICDDLERAFPRKRVFDLARADSKVFGKEDMKKTLKTDPLVSIIVPSYNHAIYLPETLNSVSAQTYTNWECIIVNDGSSDNTEEVARQYCEKDERFKYIYQKNAGPAAARNAGIKKSKGKLILPLDADDLISNDYLTEAVGIFEENPASKLVYCEAELFGEASGLCKLPNYSFDELLFSNMILCGAMYKRSDYDKMSGYNLNMKDGMEDWDFWLSLLKKDDLVYQIPKVHFYYRIRSNSRNNRVFKDKELFEAMFEKIFSNHRNLYEGKINPLYTNYLLQQKNEELRQKSEELQQKEAALNHIYNSHGWRVLSIYYRLRDKIFPVNSKRRMFAKIISNVFLLRKAPKRSVEQKKYLW
jgi:glycosyltransferase involved in cell wall biosynthesis